MPVPWHRRLATRAAVAAAFLVVVALGAWLVAVTGLAADRSFSPGAAGGGIGGESTSLTVAFLISAGAVVCLTVLAAGWVFSARMSRLKSDYERHRAVTESASEAIVSTDDHGAITFWNRGAAVLFGGDEAKVSGTPFADLIAPPDRSRWLDAMASLARGDGAAAIELEGLRGDTTTLPIELSLAAAQTRGRGQVTMVIRDRTARARAQESQRQQTESLQQAERMDAIGRLAGGVAHDFNNLLTSIIGFSSLVRDSVQDDALRADIDEVLGAADRAAGLTRQLLALSRHDALTPQIVAPDQIVANTERMLRRLIGADITLYTVVAPRLGSIRADPRQVEQVLINLAVNGRDEMPNGGDLRIELSNADLDAAGAASHPGLTPGRYVLIAVTDTGTGVAPALIGHTFEPFFTTRADGKGGLGLATVYGMVKQNGGHIELDSELNRGTTFRVYFPRLDVAEPDLDVGQPVSAVEPASETVLLVEDDDRVRGLVAHVLRRRGYTVLEASRGDEALALAERYAATIHLLLSDIVMPGMSGRIVADRVIEARPATRVLLMSGYSEDAVLHSGVEPSKTPFIQKPFSMEALTAKIREALGGPAVT